MQMQRVTRHYKAQNRKWGELFITGMITCCVLGTIYIFNIGITTLALIGSFILLYLLRYPRKTFLLFVFSIPLGEIFIDTGIISISAPNVLMLIIVFALFIRFIISSPDLSLPQIIKINLIALFFFIFSYLVADLHAKDVIYALNNSTIIIGFALSFVFPLILIRSLDEYRKVFIFQVISALLLAILSILASFGYGPVQYGGIFTPRFASANRVIMGKYATQAFMASRGGYGCWLESAISILAVSIFCKRKFFFKNKFPVILIFPIMLLAVIIPTSRSTWLATSLALIVILYFTLFVLKKQHYFSLTVTPLFISLLVILVFWPPDMVKSLIWKIYEMNPSGVEGRFLEAQEGFRVGIRNLLFGLGAGGYSAYVQPFSKVIPGMCIHNVFAATFADGGILGFISLVIIWIISFYICLQIIMKPKNEVIRLFAISMFATLIAIFTETNFYGGGDKIMWLMLGLTNCLYLLNYRMEIIKGV